MKKYTVQLYIAKEVDIESEIENNSVTKIGK